MLEYGDDMLGPVNIGSVIQTKRPKVIATVMAISISIRVNPLGGNGVTPKF